GPGGGHEGEEGEGRGGDGLGWLRGGGLGGHLRAAGDRARRYGGTGSAARRWRALHRRCGVLRVSPAEPVAEDVRSPRVLSCLHAARRAVPPGCALLCPVPLAPADIKRALERANGHCLHGWIDSIGGSWAGAANTIKYPSAGARRQNPTSRYASAASSHRKSLGGVPWNCVSLSLSTMATRPPGTRAACRL